MIVRQNNICLTMLHNIKKGICFMAREKKEEKPKAPKPKPIERYYATYENYSFVYPLVDEDGKPKFKTNPVTGANVYDVDGNPIILTKMEKFETISNMMSKGYLSCATHDPNDTSAQNQIRGEKLKYISNAENISVYTEGAHEERTNRDAWLEKKRVRELQNKVDSLEDELKSYRELDAQIAEIEGKE